MVIRPGVLYEDGLTVSLTGYLGWELVSFNSYVKVQNNLI